MGEELEAVLPVLSVLLTLSAADDGDKSFDFLSVLFEAVVAAAAAPAVVVVGVVVVEDVADVELESGPVLSLSDFVLSLDFASSVDYLKKMGKFGK